MGIPMYPHVLPSSAPHDGGAASASSPGSGPGAAGTMSHYYPHVANVPSDAQCKKLAGNATWQHDLLNHACFDSLVFSLYRFSIFTVQSSQGHALCSYWSNSRVHFDVPEAISSGLTQV